MAGKIKRVFSHGPLESIELSATIRELKMSEYFLSVILVSCCEMAAVSFLLLRHASGAALASLSATSHSLDQGCRTRIYSGPKLKS